MRIQPTYSADGMRAAYVDAGLWGSPQHFGAIERIAAADPERRAVVDSYGSFSYAELDEAIRRARTWLTERGLEPGGAAVAVLPNWFESLVWYHAVLRSGGVAVPLSTHARAAEIRHAVRATGARILAVPASHRDASERLGVPVGILAPARGADEPSDIRSSDPAGSPAVPRHDDVAMVLFTSGTTADPKGAIHTHDTLAVANRNLSWALGLGDTDVHYVPSPVAHVSGLMQALHMPFENGATVILDDHWDPDRAAERIEAERATFTGGAPVFIEGLLTAYALRPPGSCPLRTAVTGGAGIRAGLVTHAKRVLGVRVARSYGSTECIFASGSLPGDDLAACEADDGALMPGVEARLGAGGELLVRAASMFQGYVDPAHNPEAFEGEWFRTGDIAEVHGTRLKVAGRIKAIAIRRGENVSLDEVERALEGWTSAREVAAFALPDEETGERVVVAVVPAGHADPSYEGMIAHLSRSEMATQKYPEQIVIWPRALPRTASGKVDRRALAEKAGARPSVYAPRLKGKEAGVGGQR